VTEVVLAVTEVVLVVTAVVLAVTAVVLAVTAVVLAATAVVLAATALGLAEAELGLAVAWAVFMLGLPGGLRVGAGQALHFGQHKTQVLGMEALFAGGHKAAIGWPLQGGF
jgi:hypothetical protein